jgi:hypothetical protein
MDKIEVTCVNARNKPNEIPFTHWVKEQQPYNIIKVVRCMGGIAGVEIEEIDHTINPSTIKINNHVINGTLSNVISSSSFRGFFLKGFIIQI